MNSVMNWHHTCNDHRGTLCGLFPLFDSVLVHFILYLLEFVHSIQTVSPPLLLHCFAQFWLICELLSCLNDLLLKGKSALQVPQKGILQTSAIGGPYTKKKINVTIKYSSIVIQFQFWFIIRDVTHLVSGKLLSIPCHMTSNSVWVIVIIEFVMDCNTVCTSVMHIKHNTVTQWKIQDSYLL